MILRGREGDRALESGFGHLVESEERSSSQSIQALV